MGHIFVNQFLTKQNLRSMKKIPFQWMFLLVFAAALSFAACGSDAGHDHDGHDHDHDGTEQTDAANNDADAGTANMEGEGADMSGPEYTSAYVCPMHCKGSGAAEPGKCPVCGMDLMENPNYQKK